MILYDITYIYIIFIFYKTLFTNVLGGEAPQLQVGL